MLFGLGVDPDVQGERMTAFRIDGGVPRQNSIEIGMHVVRELHRVVDVDRVGAGRALRQPSDVVRACLDSH